MLNQIKENETEENTKEGIISKWRNFLVNSGFISSTMNQKMLANR